MRIMGIDPSLRQTGWGVIDYVEEVICHVAHGAIPTSVRSATEKRLAELCAQAEILVRDYKPDLICLEETFCGLNPITTLRLGFASGALLATFGRTDIPVIRYATRLVKQMITENGGCDKHMIKEKMLEILSLESIHTLDASDALAVAVAHVFLQNRPAKPLVKPKQPRKKKVG